MSKPKVSLKSITLNCGTTLDLSPSDKLLFVGANNSGKSQTLRDIVSLVKSISPIPTKVVTDVVLDKQGTSASLTKFLSENALRTEHFYLLGDWQVSIHELDRWDNYPNQLPGDLSAGYIKVIDAERRLAISGLAEAPRHGEIAQNPQQYIYNSDPSAQEVSSLFEAAFGQELFFDYRGGQHIPLHVGAAPDRQLMPDRVGADYVAAVRKQPLLREQGDGMKAYAGILLETIATARDILLLDEPEAFLHPPQMRKLGETLAMKVTSQLLVATHSSDILRGFLEGAKGNVRILRIDRKDTKNFIKEVPPAIIKGLWDQPALRYSNAFDAIFHEQAILCEDDSDCRLYSAIEGYLQGAGISPKIDTAYVPAGGKSGIAKIAAALRPTGVPIKAIFDIDLLNDGTLLRTTIESFGGIWDQIEPSYRRLAAAVTAGIKPKDEAEIKEAIINLCRNEPGLPKSKIKDALGSNNSWNILKRAGVAGLPRGEARQSYSTVEQFLAKLGIFLVPVGEAENFCPGIGSHGPKFVTQLLERIPLDSPDLSDLRDFAIRFIPRLDDQD